MDAAVSISIILFILSMINERISNFIKLQFSDKKLFWINVGNLRSKTDNDETEDDRTKRILALNVICGTLVALALRADLISILGNLEKPYEVIGWDKPVPNQVGEWLMLILGTFLTGCFLSLGSKFWHDLLDLLFYTKNLKSKLVDERTYQQTDDIQHLQEFINTPEYKLSQIAVDTYRASLNSTPGVLSFGTGYVNKGSGKIGCLEIHVTDIDVANKIEKNFKIKLSTGANINIPSKVIVTGDYPKLNSATAGKGVSNKSGILGRGTIGAIVKDNIGDDHYILSCFHVLNGDNNWSGLSDSKEIQDENGNIIAELYFGYRTTDMDVAIAKLKTGVTYSNNLINNPTSVRQVSYDDVLQESTISILGAKTQETIKGFVYNDSWPVSFRYPDNNLWELTDLLVLTKYDKNSNSYKALTQGGDSGALVIDNKNIAIAMIVGADNSFSYAIKLDKIIKNLDISL